MLIGGENNGEMMSNNQVEYDYDYKGDSLFIYCVNPYEYEVSQELDNDVILDLDDCDKPVAFEFLNASKVFGLDKSYFKSLVKIIIQSKINVDTISLKVQLIDSVHNKNQVFDVDMVTGNLNNVSEIETMLVTVCVSTKTFFLFLLINSI